MKFIHSDLPGMMMKDLVLKEMKEAGMDDLAPDFAAMLVAGMSVADREGQLRYETDESGNILLNEEGKPTYRPCYQLKQFVANKGSHVELGLPVVWHWTTNQLVDHILKVEVEQGLIVKPKKARAARKAATEEIEMAGEGRRVTMVHQGGKTAAAAPAAGPQHPPPAPGAPVNVQVGGPGRVAAPPLRTGTPPPPGPQGGPPVQANRPPVAGPRPVNPRPVEPRIEEPAPAAADDMVSVMQKIVETALDNLGNELRLAIGTEVKKQVEDLRNAVIQHIEASSMQTLQAVTLAHDIAARTSGQYWEPALDANGYHMMDENNQPVYVPADQYWDHPDLILGAVPKGPKGG
jgi:hypothetical protein